MKILLSFCIAFFVGSPAVALNYFVNSTGDAPDAGLDGACNTGGMVGGQVECTLRALIQEINATAAEDSIGFLISNCPNGVCTITINSLLPEIISPVIIDASSQGGNGGVCGDITGREEYKIVIQGNGGFDGLRLGSGSDGSVISGLNLRNFFNPITIINSNNNQVKCNLIGTDQSGMALANNNGANGVILGCSSKDNIIGGMNNEGNVISGHAGDGIQFYGGFSCNPTDNEPKNNAILGNFIGTLKDGTTAAGNAYSGISFFGGAASDNHIGSLTDSTSLSPNVIAANESGIYIGDEVSGTTILGNYIGTDLSGSVDLGNVYGGVDIISGHDTKIGGDSLVNSNTIAYNSQGIFISGETSSGNHYSRNLIYHNDTVAVDIVRDGGTEPDGINANDTDDADTGANHLMNNVAVSAVTVIEDQMIGNFAQFDLMVDATEQNAAYPLWIEAYVAPYGSDIFELRSGSIYQNAQQAVLYMVDLQGQTSTQVKFVLTDDDNNASEMSGIYHVNPPDVIYKNGFEQQP
ncbi:hypothetical protein [Marinicella rhabdoformis]|uniref:hypothetical protein n=1 Tax=Marinicella rhabdoformis TaxID=2580566 RepID=UPI0012AEBAC1|nr:hypothetical protein [Marinicella rhabdoformis]